MALSVPDGEDLQAPKPLTPSYRSEGEKALVGVADFVFDSF